LVVGPFRAVRAIIALDAADGHNLTVIRGRASVQRLCTLSGIEAQLIFVDDPADLRPPV
jgi:hypothetical protein